MNTMVQEKEKPVALSGNAAIERTPQYYRLKADVEDFYYREADLLDERRFREWLDLLTDDIVYFMPIRRNFTSARSRCKTRRSSQTLKLATR